MDQDQVCHVCCQKVGGAHSCKRCKKFVHVFCGIAEGEEGFGQQVTCNTCNAPIDGK